MLFSTARLENLSEFRLENLFGAQKSLAIPRTIYVNEELAPEYRDRKGLVKKEYIYPTNQVISSKYTVITFLPRTLLEQFRRVANVFFLIAAILQLFPQFTTISPGVVFLPLLAIVGATAAKDGYEDYKRHQADRQVNQSVVRVLRGAGWANPNVTGGKTKTFTRRTLFRRKPREKVSAGSTSVVSDEIQEAEPQFEDDKGSTMEVENVLDDAEYEHNGHVSDRSRVHNATHDLPRWQKTLWEDVCVGDFVKIMDNESFPADIVICATSNDDNACYIETKNLDGETNLKLRSAVSGLTHIRSAGDCTDRSKSSFHIDCDAPSADLYRLNAKVVMADNSTYPVDLQTVLLRGAVLKDTKWVIGVVLFTGENTKIIQNAGQTPSKRSRVERQTNPQVAVNLILLLTMAVVCAVADSVDEHKFFPEGAPWLYGDDTSDDNPSINAGITWAFAFIVFANVIPIALYISMEGVRSLQALFIYFDKAIQYEKTGQPTIARSWNLSDDLGQIEYIFSDKTGTLTQNIMVFRQCSINGKVYGRDEPQEVNVQPPRSANPSPDIVEVMRTPPETTERLGPDNDHTFHAGVLRQDLAVPVEGKFESLDILQTFWRVLALCHTALASINPETHELEYKAQSPDEIALVQAAANVGFAFRGKDKECLLLQTPFDEQLERYELLNVLDFTSARKRMSVIVRRLDSSGDNRILVFTKGADSVIYERLVPGGDELKQTTTQHLNQFANEGWRTLTLGYKFVEEEYYWQWNARCHDAMVALDDRDELVESVWDEMEQDFHLLGATALEDRLQDGVADTIEDLKRAGIKIWVATGDKLETAIAIGYSTNLIARDSNLIIIRDGGPTIYDQMCTAAERYFPDKDIFKGMDMESRNLTQTAQGIPLYNLTRISPSNSVRRGNAIRSSSNVLVIDGSSLAFALADDFSKEVLLRLSTQCQAVICCRVSPLQKALIVKLVKRGLGAMTLAIGDGANDVSMIQAAHVGVGISGEEGLQAVNSSDYAIAQFRFLKRLLLVHGHWSYARNANIILNFFYKDFVVVGILWWYQIYCGWTIQHVMDYTYILFYDVFFVLLSPLAMGTFDRVADDDILMDVPELYRYGREGHWYSTKRYFLRLLDAVYQSVVVFFFITYAYNTNTVRSDGYAGYIYEFSTCMALCAVMIANAYIGLNFSAWTKPAIFMVSFGVIVIWVYTPIFATVVDADVYGNNVFLFESAIFWLCIPLVFCLALLPRFVAIALRIGLFPTDIDIVKSIRNEDPTFNFKRDAHWQGGGEDFSIRKSPVPTQDESPNASTRRLTPQVRDSFDGREIAPVTASGVHHRHAFNFGGEDPGDEFPQHVSFHTAED